VLTTHYDQCQRGNTVPYGRLFRGLNRNHGFVDLRGRPDLVARIPEVAQSPALKVLLSQAAQSQSPLFTLGCDLGAHQEETDENGVTHVAGGYVQLMKAAYDRTSRQQYFALTRSITELVEIAAVGYCWELRFECTPVDFKLDKHSGIIPSLWIWFFASDTTAVVAANSREALIGALIDSLLGVSRTLRT
jgi:hypothetical protein